MQLALLAALVILLPLLAWLQYDLLGRLSERERERMQASAKSAAQRIGEEFDRTLAHFYTMFQPVRAAERDPVESAAADYLHWRASDPSADLVRELYLFGESQKNDTILHFNTDSGAFERIPWPAELRSLRAHQPELPGGFDSDLLEPLTAIVFPVVSIEERDGQLPAIVKERTSQWALLLLDRDRLFSQVIMPLFRQYFGQAGGLDYQAIVVSDDANHHLLFSSNTGLKAADFARPDAETELFTGRMRDFIFITSEATGPHSVTGTGSFTVTRFLNRTTESRIELRVGDERKARWLLRVRHRAGSLEAAVGEARNRNLALSFLVLSLLAGTAVSLFVSARRAGRLARQQLEFVAGVTHELRTPLSVIRSAADNLADAVVSAPEQVRQYGQLIGREGVRMSTLVENLLLFSRLRSGADFLDQSPVDLTFFLQQLIAERNALPGADPAALSLSADGELPPVFADERALRTIFINLFDNALRYSDVPTTVSVSLAPATQGQTPAVRAEVRDSGWGMDADELRHMFQPFFRGATARERNVPGNGIGLNLVKRLVELHGGTVGVSSERDRGSVFTVVLPVAAMDDAPLGDEHA